MATKVNVRPHRGASPPSEGMWKWSQLVMPISSKSCCSVESFSSISGDDIKEQEKKKKVSQVKFFLLVLLKSWDIIQRYFTQHRRHDIPWRNETMLCGLKRFSHLLLKSP